MASPTAAPRAACCFFCAAARNTADLFIEINFVPLQTADLFASAANQCDQVDDCAVFAVRRVCYSVIISDQSTAQGLSSLPSSSTSIRMRSRGPFSGCMFVPTTEFSSHSPCPIAHAKKADSEALTRFAAVGRGHRPAWPARADDRSLNILAFRWRLPRSDCLT